MCELGPTTQRLFLAVILFFGIPEVHDHDTTSEQSILEEALEGTL